MNMKNAKEELLEELLEEGLSLSHITKARVSWEWPGPSGRRLTSKNGSYNVFTQENIEDLLVFLDVNYDNGWGNQMLWGDIVISKEVWFERDEYDGKEYWKKRQCPEF